MQCRNIFECETKHLPSTEGCWALPANRERENSGPHAKAQHVVAESSRSAPSRLVVPGLLWQSAWCKILMWYFQSNWEAFLQPRCQLVNNLLDFWQESRGGFKFTRTGIRLLLKSKSFFRWLENTSPLTQKTPLPFEWEEKRLHVTNNSQLAAYNSALEDGLDCSNSTLSCSNF